MTIEEWAKDFKSYVNELQMPNDDYKGIMSYIDDALLLLKEQEAKPMIENEHGWNCPSCGMKLIGKTASGYPCDLIDLPEDEPIHFCPKCGQAVKWDE